MLFVRESICVHVCMYLGMYVRFRGGTHVRIVASEGMGLMDGWMAVLVPVPGVRSAGGS